MQNTFPTNENHFDLQALLFERTHPIKQDPDRVLQVDPRSHRYPHDYDAKDYKTKEDKKEEEADKKLFKRKKVRTTKSAGSLIPGSFTNDPIAHSMRHPHKKLPEALYPLHNVCAFVGPRGSGKTTALINLVAQYLKHKAFDRIKIISPTYDSNPEYEYLFQKLRIPEEEQDQHICKDPNIAPAFLDVFLRDFKADGKEYEEVHKYKSVWEKWAKNKPLTNNEVDMLASNQYSPPPDIEKPSAALIVDDMTHTPLLSRFSSYPHLLIKHRHVGGTNIGISIFTLVHNFKSGIPKCARQNVQVFHLFPMSDETQLKSIWEETACGCTTFQEFFSLYKAGIQDEEALKKGEQSHNFFTIDPYNGSIDKRFRRNFNEYLTSVPMVSLESDEALNNLPTNLPPSG